MEVLPIPTLLVILPLIFCLQRFNEIPFHLIITELLFLTSEGASDPSANNGPILRPISTPSMLEEASVPGPSNEIIFPHINAPPSLQEASVPSNNNGPIVPPIPTPTMPEGASVPSNNNGPIVPPIPTPTTLVTSNALIVPYINTQIGEIRRTK